MRLSSACGNLPSQATDSDASCWCKWFLHSFQSENAAVSDPPFSAIARYWDICGRRCFHIPWCAVSIASWGGRNGRPTSGLMMFRKDIWDCFDLDDGRALKREVSWFKKLLQGILCSAWSSPFCNRWQYCSLDEGSLSNFLCILANCSQPL